MNPLVKCVLIFGGVCVAKWAVFYVIKAWHRFFHIALVFAILGATACAQEGTGGSADSDRLDMLIVAAGLISGQKIFNALAARWYP